MIALNPKQKKIIQRLQSGWWSRFFFLLHIPSLFFWRISVRELNGTSCSVIVPYGWRTKNPFRSIYFATQAGAAELSTGALGLLAVEGKNVSMLVTGIEGEYTKKATTVCTFTCVEGANIFNAVHLAIESNQPQTIVVTSTGRNREGEIVSRFHFTWSFKKR